jgi:hypothetical protein
VARLERLSKVIAVVLAVLIALNVVAKLWLGVVFLALLFVAQLFFIWTRYRARRRAA